MKIDDINRANLLKTLISLMLVFSLFGCVYYNTFYNARKAFDDAESKQKNVKTRSTRVASGQYNKAIEKSLKVIEDYPNSKWYDDALYVLGVSYYRTGQYGKADRRFRELMANYPKSKYIKDSELFLAKTKLELKEQVDAMQIFEKIFNSKYDKSFKTEAALGLGLYYYDQHNISEAIPYFLAVRDSLGNKEEKKLAQTYIADGYYEMFRFKDALSAYLQVLGMEPTLEDKFHALYSAASSSYRLLRVDDGLGYVNTLLNDEKYFDSTNVLLLKLAEGYEIEDDLDNALDLYERVSQDDVPRNKRFAGMAHYRIGLIQQFDYDDLTKAKEHYDSALQLLGRTGEEGQEALARSSDIGKLDTYARKLVIDSTTTQEMIDDAAFTQYQLSELYWFNLNKPDTAILEMQYLIDSFPTAYDVPKAMISLSQMYRTHYNDTTTADSLLNQMLELYPSSDYASQALEQLGLLGTSADTGYAKKYLDMAETYLVDDSLIDSAKYYYQYVVDHFPESEFYLQARFALLWVMEEYTPPGDSSLIFAYEAYVDSFPTSPWTKEVRDRLKGTPRRRGPRQNDDINEIPTMDSLNQLRDEQIYAAQDGQVNQDSVTYIDPLEAIYIDPNGQKAIAFNLEPIEIKQQFEYPVEAYKDAFEGEIYFQIFLDFTGEVVDYVQKTRSGNDELDKKVAETIASMTFDPLRIPAEIAGNWFVYKFRVRLPDQLR